MFTEEELTIEVTNPSDKTKQAIKKLTNKDYSDKVIITTDRNTSNEDRQVRVTVTRYSDTSVLQGELALSYLHRLAKNIDNNTN